MSSQLHDVYNQKLTSPEQAVKVIKDGDWVEFGLGVGMPSSLINALAKRRDTLRNVNLRQTFWILPNDAYISREGQNAFTINSWFMSSNTRDIVNNGRSNTTPGHFSEYPKYYTEYLANDVMMISVSPMDNLGYFSFGTGVSYHQAAAEKSKIVIVEANENQPYIYGETFIHISEIDMIVESSTPLPVLSSPLINPIDMAIGETIAELIEDGSTLQIGIGGIPNAVGSFLKGKKDLGIHTEMFVDSMIDLIEAGAVTGKRKSIHKEKVVGTFAAGSKKLYKYINRNPIIEGYPVSYINDPYVIAQNKKMIAINSTAEVDLTGQCASESLGTWMLSGSGGQVDFCRGAYNSDGGKAFLCLHSTTREGTKSKIVPCLPQGSVVTTPRTDVHYIVTEYGSAMLKGKTLRERAHALIAISHPDFRNELKAAAKKLNLI